LDFIWYVNFFLEVVMRLLLYLRIAYVNLWAMARLSLDLVLVFAAAAFIGVAVLAFAKQAFLLLLGL
jgi:hypothetical protein